MSENSSASQADSAELIDTKKYESYPHLFARMLTDSWSFGIRLRDGWTIPVSYIDEPKEKFGTWWVDVTMSEFDLSHDDRNKHLRFLKCPSEERNIMTVRVDEIAAIFELADT